MQTLRKKYLMKRSVVIPVVSYFLFLTYTLASKMFSHKASFLHALTARADADRYVILAMTDEGFADMALNFHESSLRAHNIDNFLFVGVGRKTCNLLKNTPCFYYTDDPSEDTASAYGQRDYVRKMNIRTDMILEALTANFTVIHTDTDVAFLNNPLNKIKVAVQNADIAALWDYRVFNAGFLVVRPSTFGQQLYQSVRQMTARTRIDDQKALNKAISMMKKQEEHGRVLRVNVLDRNQFLSGYYYFEKYGRRLPKLCEGSKPLNKSSCPLVVHNNWIIGKEAKIYRFREHLMWQYDGHNQYYSSETRKYLTYTYPKPRNRIARKTVIEYQISALKTALAVGQLLNRVIILPKFYCDRPTAWQCFLNSIIDVKTFDDHFSGRYRESSFLRHPKVPDSVKHGVIDRKFSVRLNQQSNVPVSGTDIIRLFSEVSDKVLNISNLQRIKIEMDDESLDYEFSGKLETAFRRSNVRQSGIQ